MPKTGLRPHTWKIQGEIPHQQYLAWLQSRAQASYRKEPFELTFEQYQELWQGFWDRKGRSINDYCLSRLDPSGSWAVSNLAVMPRLEHIRRQKEFTMEKRKNGRSTNGL
jgi:hypothetical protein